MAIVPQWAESIASLHSFQFNTPKYVSDRKSDHHFFILIKDFFLLLNGTYGLYFLVLSPVGTFFRLFVCVGERLKGDTLINPKNCRPTWPYEAKIHRRKFWMKQLILISRIDHANCSFVNSQANDKTPPYHLFFSLFCETFVRQLTPSILSQNDDIFTKSSVVTSFYLVFISS